MQPYEQRYKPWWYLQQAVEVDRIDAAVLAEELVEIYSTPTPNVWLEPKKVIDLYLIDWFSTIAGVWYLYPEPKTNPTRVRHNTIFGMMKTFLI